MGKPVKKVKRRKRIRKSFVMGVLTIVVSCFLLIQAPGWLDTVNLKDLGYTKTEIKAIRKHKVTKVILKNDYYSANLASSLLQDNFNKEVIELYVTMDETTQDDILLYQKLQKKGYSVEQLLPLFQEFEFYEMTPLLVFDYQADLTAYMEDVKTHRSTNSQDVFKLDGNYYSYYQNAQAAQNPDNVNVLVNKTYYLDQGYSPSDLVDLKLAYATKGMSLRQEAADQFILMCEAVKAAGMTIFASSSYRDYNYQVELYNDYVHDMGEEGADALSARPGHSEHQTGLTVDVAAYAKGLNKFLDSNEYQWMLANAQNYGWILRFPEGKEQITGYDFEPWHYRYVGVDLAKKIVNSHLTYDEYYLLYIAE